MRKLCPNLIIPRHFTALLPQENRHTQLLEFTEKREQRESRIPTFFCDSVGEEASRTSASFDGFVGEKAWRICQLKKEMKEDIKEVEERDRKKGTQEGKKKASKEEGFVLPSHVIAVASRMQAAHHSSARPSLVHARPTPFPTRLTLVRPLTPPTTASSPLATSHTRPAATKPVPTDCTHSHLPQKLYTGA